MGDMLTAYRRHLKTCPHRSKGRTYRRCSCPIWVQGTLEGQSVRRSLDLANWERAAEVIREMEATGSDLLVMAGDFNDQGAASRWPKLSRPMPLVEEFRRGRVVASALSEAFRRIVVLPGNHDKRLMKRLIDGGMPDDVVEYIRHAAPVAFDPPHFVFDGLSNIEMAEPIACGDAKYDYIWQHGDLVVGHPETYSVIPARGAGYFLNWVAKTAIPAGIIKAPVKLVLQGHTHGAGLVWSDYGVPTSPGAQAHDDPPQRNLCRKSVTSAASPASLAVRSPGSVDCVQAIEPDT